MIGVERALSLVLLLLTEPKEALDTRLAVRPVLPLTRRAPRKFCRFRCALQCLARIEQRLDIDSVVDRRHSHREAPFPCVDISPKSRIIQRTWPARQKLYDRVHGLRQDRRGIRRYRRNAVLETSTTAPAG